MEYLDFYKEADMIAKKMKEEGVTPKSKGFMPKRGKEVQPSLKDELMDYFLLVDSLPSPDTVKD